MPRNQYFSLPEVTFDTSRGCRLKTASEHYFILFVPSERMSYQGGRNSNNRGYNYSGQGNNNNRDGYNNRDGDRGRGGGRGGRGGRGGSAPEQQGKLDLIDQQSDSL